MTVSLWGLGSRLIPARAGNTVGRSPTRWRLPAHPRSRGEHSSRDASAFPYYGSSPLARGTQGDKEDGAGADGLIPARAGNTSLSNIKFGYVPAHPRSRGEHSLPVEVAAANGGSSPLARGTRQRSGRIINARRLIPARAGNTQILWQNCPVRPAHPRSRGEHGTAAARGSHRHGSSPLARGTQGRRVHEPTPARLIPARAGNTPLQGR